MSTKSTEDRRSSRTREHLQQALFELLETHAYDAITIQQIADRAMINRTTFYNHYEDKVDLLEIPVGSSLIGQEIHSLFLPKKAVVAGVIRGRSVFLGEERVVLEKGDRILILAPHQIADQISQKIVP